MEHLSHHSQSLRKRAEAALQRLGATALEHGGEDLATLLQELTIHQIELEMQGEELRTSTEALARSKALYFQYFEAAPVPILRVTREGRVIESNLAAAEMLEIQRRTSSEFPRHLLERLLDAGELARFRRLLSDALSAGFPVPADIRMRTPSGRACVFSVTALALSEAPVPEILLFFQDETESRLRSSEFERLSLLARHTDNTVIFTDAARRIVWVNDGFTQLTGYSAGEVRGKSPSLLQGPDTDRKTIERLRKALNAGHGIKEEILNYKKDGSPYWVAIEITPQRKPDGALNGFMCVERDVTARHLRESELLNLRTAVAQSANAILITDAAGTIEFVNPAFEKTTGYSAGEVIGQNPRILKSGKQGPRFYEDLWKQISSGKTWRGTFHNRRKDGSLYWESTTISPITDPDGAIQRYIAIKENITEKIAAEEALRETSLRAEAASRAKGEFLANMSHEIRTPLNAIIGASELLENNPHDAEAGELFEMIRSSGEVLLALINDILDFSKIEAGQLELKPVAFDIRACARQSIQMVFKMAAAKNIHLDLDIAPGLPDVFYGDEAKLRQVLINLLANGVKFTDKGQVSLAISCPPNAPNKISFAVRDTGIGIPPDQQHKLFHSFSQIDASNARRYGGTGLGLAISQRIIRMMGGEITVESTPGAGSTFHFEIPGPGGQPPPPDPERPSHPPEPEAPLGDRCPLRILLAEDNPVNQRLVVMILRRIGYEPALAGNGHEVLMALESGPFDLILMDVQMPGMDGLAASRRIVELYPPEKRPYMIALTANAMSGDRQLCLDAGMDGYLSKPVHPNKLAEAIEQAHGDLGRRRA